MNYLLLILYNHIVENLNQERSGKNDLKVLEEKKYEDSVEVDTSAQESTDYQDKDPSNTIENSTDTNSMEQLHPEKNEEYTKLKQIEQDLLSQLSDIKTKNEELHNAIAILNSENTQL